MAGSGNEPFAGNTALIFGGAKGIGKSVALEWARRGAKLVIADIDENASVETAREIEAQGGSAIGLGANVMSQESMQAAVDEAENAFGEIGIVMNNVGAILNGHPADIPMEEWHRIFELNYFSAVRSNAIFVPKMQQRGSGHIVNTASFAGLYPYAAGRIPYASAKAAIISMTENLAILLEPCGVRVSCLIPGPVATSIMDGMTSWTPDMPMYAGGSELTLMLPDAVGTVLADGMRDGRILIPSDDTAWDIVRRRAAGPDQFVRDKIEQFGRGETGSPQIPEAIRQAMAARQ